MVAEDEHYVLISWHWIKRYSTNSWMTVLFVFDQSCIPLSQSKSTMAFFFNYLTLIQLSRSHRFSYFNKTGYVYQKQIHLTRKQKKLFGYWSPLTKHPTLSLSPVKCYNFRTTVFWGWQWWYSPLICDYYPNLVMYNNAGILSDIVTVK
jgi:hypothetical protein